MIPDGHGVQRIVRSTRVKGGISRDMCMAIQMTTEERLLLKEWNARLTAEGLGMSRGLPPKKVKLVRYIDEMSPDDIQDSE